MTGERRSREGISRRGALVALGAALAARGLRAQKKGMGPLPRATPALCLYSEAVKIDYNDSGPFIQAMGFDGVELAIVPGGHIPLEGDIDLHLERAIEAMTGNQLDVPVLSTTVTSAQTVQLRTILAWGNEMGVPILSPGQWPNNGQGMADMARAQREISYLAAIGQQAKMQIALHNATPNYIGSSIAELNGAIQPFSPIIGFNFDVGYAAAYSGAGPGDGAGGKASLLAALHLALPRLKMVTARDCKWTKGSDGEPTLTQCPLGEGMVDWPPFFAALAKANFTGPVTLRVEYQPKDDLVAIRKDLAFLKKQRDAAHAG